MSKLSKKISIQLLTVFILMTGFVMNVSADNTQTVMSNDGLVNVVVEKIDSGDSVDIKLSDVSEDKENYEITNISVSEEDIEFEQSNDYLVKHLVGSNGDYKFTINYTRFELMEIDGEEVTREFQESMTFVVTVDSIKNTQTEELPEVIEPTEEETQEENDPNIEFLVVEDQEKTEENLQELFPDENLNEIEFYGVLPDGTEIRFESYQEAVAFSINPDSGNIVVWDHDPGYGYGTPIIKAVKNGEEKYLYCGQPYETWPTGQPYDNARYENPGIHAILSYGFPSDETGLKGKYGKSDTQAYVATFVALNAYLNNYDRSTVEGAGDGYVNELLKEADKGYTNLSFSVDNSNNVSVYNSTKNRLESKEFFKIKVNRNTTQTFTLEGLPSGVYAIDKNGNKISSIQYNQEFKLATDDLAYSNNGFTATVNHNIQESALYQFTAPGVQTLYGFWGHDPLIKVEFKQSFDAVDSQIQILKKDTESNPIKGTKFRISYSNAVDPVTDFLLTGTDVITGADGKTPYESFTNSGATVYIQEIEVPAPYVLNKEIKQATVTPGTKQTLTFTNDKAQGRISIYKADEHRNAVANVHYEILRHSDRVSMGTLITNASGDALSGLLDLDKYIVKETKTVNGLVLDSTEYVVTLSYKDQVTPVVTTDKYFTNYYQKSNLVLTKVEDNWDTTFPEYNGKKLEGAQISLYAKNDIYEGTTKVASANQKIDTKTSNTLGQVYFNNLSPGLYYAKEDVAPHGYVLNTGQWDIEIKYDGSKPTTYVTTTEKTITNRVISGSVELVKVDNKGTKRLEGAQFGLYYKGTYVRSYTTDADGRIVIDNLRYDDLDKYELHEEVAPGGYWMDTTPIKFSITENKKTVYLVAPNVLIETHLQFRKLDEAFNPLPGVGFSIRDVDTGEFVTLKYAHNGKVIEEDVWYTDEDGRVFINGNLEVGNYELVEVDPQEGMQPIAPIPFTVDENSDFIDLGVHIGLSLDLGDIINYWNRADILIKKIDATTGLPLQYFGFNLYDLQGNLISYIETNEDGEALLPNNIYGRYRVEEVKVHGDYVIDYDNNIVDVFIEEHGKTYEVVFENVQTNIKVKKQDGISKEGLKDFKFNLLDEDMNILVEDLQTDADGFFEVRGHDFGVYHIEEMATAGNYVIDPERKIQRIELTPENYEVEVVFENVETYVLLKKIDEDTGEAIPGTVFDIYQNGEVVATETTNEDGEILLAGYDFSTVGFKEISVPAPWIVDEENNYQEVVLTQDTPTYEVTFKNKKAVGEDRLIKRDKKTNKTIKGVEYAYYDITDMLIEVNPITGEVIEHNLLTYQDLLKVDRMATVKTDENGEAFVTGLDISRVYARIEVSTPYGYKIDETVNVVKFEYIDQETELIINETELFNERLQVTIKGVKVDSKTKSQIISKYFELELKDSEGNVIPIDHKDDDGVHYWLVDALEYYDMKENKAPKGYILSDEVVKISTHEEEKDHIYVIEFPNDAEPVYLPQTGIDTPINNTIALFMMVVAAMFLLLTAKQDSIAKLSGISIEPVNDFEANLITKHQTVESVKELNEESVSVLDAKENESLVNGKSEGGVINEHEKKIE